MDPGAYFDFHWVLQKAPVTATCLTFDGATSGRYQCVRLLPLKFNVFMFNHAVEDCAGEI